MKALDGNPMTEEQLFDIEDLENDAQQLYEHWKIAVDMGQTPVRIDRFLAEKNPYQSRNRIQQAADSGFIHVNDKPVKSNYKVRPGDVITLMLDRPKHETSIIAEDIPLQIVYEDNVLMVVNKPAGMVVHSGAGNFTGTLINAVAWHLRDLEGFDANDPEVGLVHRIDKDTSGLLVVAKTAAAKTALGKQFFNKTTRRSYNALVWGNLVEDTGTIEGNIARDPKNRLRMKVFPADSGIGKHAVTHYRVIERYGYTTLVECLLETGRTHQGNAAALTELSFRTASSAVRGRPYTPKPWGSFTPRQAVRWTSTLRGPTTSADSSRNGGLISREQRKTHLQRTSKSI